MSTKANVVQAWGGLIARDVQEGVRIALAGGHPLVVAVEGDPAPVAAALRTVTDAWGSRAPKMPLLGAWALPAHATPTAVRRATQAFEVGVVIPSVDILASDPDSNGPAVAWSWEEIVEVEAIRRRRSRVASPSPSAARKLLGADAPAARAQSTCEVARTLAAIDGATDVPPEVLAEAAALTPEVAVQAGWRRRARRTAGVGFKATTFDAKGQAYELRYRFVPLAALHISHDDDLLPSSDYPAELQPRARERMASKAQVDAIARALRPELLEADRSVAAGAPVVGPDLVVESGNGRAIALRRAMLRFPERFAAYVAYLGKRAGAWGLRAEDLDGLQAPVLVRERLTEVDRRAFVESANVAAVATSGTAEVAKTDARHVELGTLVKFQPIEGATLTEAVLAPANRWFVSEFMRTVPETERARMLDADGRLSADGARRIGAAILERVYGGEGVNLVELTLEVSDPTARNILNGIASAAPAAAKARALVESKARHDLDLGADLGWSAATLAHLQREGRSVAGLLQQGTLLSTVEIPPLRRAILEALDARRRSGKEVRALVERYAELVQKSPVPGQGGLFGGGAEVPTKDALWKRAAAGEGAPQSGFAFGEVRKGNPGDYNGEPIP